MNKLILLWIGIFFPQWRRQFLQIGNNLFSLFIANNRYCVMRHVCICLTCTNKRNFYILCFLLFLSHRKFVCFFTHKKVNKSFVENFLFYLSYSFLLYVIVNSIICCLGIPSNKLKTREETIWYKILWEK